MLLCLHFSSERRTCEGSERWASTPEHCHELASGHSGPSHGIGNVAQSQFNRTDDESEQHSQQTAPILHLTAERSESSYRLTSQQAHPKDIFLEEDTLRTLIDAGLRNSICSRPVRLAAGIKCLHDRNNCRLSDLAPAIFVPNYFHALAEQAKLIPGISKCLTNFLKSAQATDSEHLQWDPESRSKVIKDSNNMQTHLWNTLKNGTSFYKSARRIRPLRKSGTALETDPILDSSHILSVPYHTYPALDSDNASNDKSTSDEDLFVLCIDLETQANVCEEGLLKATFKDISCGYSLASESLDDIGAEAAEQRRDKIHNRPLEEREGGDPLQHKSRKCSLFNGFGAAPRLPMSHSSDVSMLLAYEGPIEVSRGLGQSRVIGGSRSLTQKVTRMHPLRQQQHESNDADQQNSAKRGDNIYEGPDLSWWSDASDAVEAPVECFLDNDTKAHLNDFYLPSRPSSETEEIHQYLDHRHCSKFEDYTRCSTASMSSRQNREDSNGSLAEVIGNDHLLWHMWQRQASVAPRGQEDVTDMKNLFVADPDMNLFSSRRDLDRSDVSSGSNEDPMLDDTRYTTSPRDISSPPISPSSERRSYFTPRRPSSSSGYVGRSSADPSRRPSLIKRFTWGERHSTPQAPSDDVLKRDQRTVEVKRRRTLEDYEAMDREVSTDDSNDMLF